MARYLIVAGTQIVNIVEYESAIPPDTDEVGNLIILEVPQGTKNVGDIYDPTPDLNERYVTKMDRVVFQELFRLTNAVRVLEAKVALTGPQYRVFIKTLI